MVVEWDIVAMSKATMSHYFFQPLVRLLSHLMLDPGYFVLSAPRKDKGLTWAKNIRGKRGKQRRKSQL